MAHPSDVPWPWDLKDALEKNKIKIEKSQNERALLCLFLAKLHKIDPDVIVGHDILGLDLTILLDRIRKENIPHWSRLGRLRRNKLKASVSIWVSLIVATIHCLIFPVSVTTFHCKKYNLIYALDNQPSLWRVHKVKYNDARYGKANLWVWTSLVSL